MFEKTRIISIISSTNESIFNVDLLSVLKQYPKHFPIEIIDFNLNTFEINDRDNEIVLANAEYPYIDTIKCKYCGKCIEYCKNNAISFFREIPLVKIDKSLCNNCFICEKKCNISAIKRKKYEIGKIIKFKITENITYSYCISLKKDKYHLALHKEILQNISALSHKVHIFNKINQTEINLIKKSDCIILLNNEYYLNNNTNFDEIINSSQNKIYDLRNTENNKQELKLIIENEIFNINKT